MALNIFGSLLLLATGLIAAEHPSAGEDIPDVEDAAHDPAKLIAFRQHRAPLP